MAAGLGALVVSGAALAQQQGGALSAAEVRELGAQMESFGADRPRVAALVALAQADRRVSAEAAAELARRVVSPCARLRAALVLCRRAEGDGAAARRLLEATLEPTERAHFASAVPGGRCGVPASPPPLAGLLAGAHPVDLGALAEQCLCDDECEVRSGCCGPGSVVHRYSAAGLERSPGCACARLQPSGGPQRAMCVARRCVEAPEDVASARPTEVTVVEAQGQPPEVVQLLTSRVAQTLRAGLQVGRPLERELRFGLTVSITPEGRIRGVSGVVPVATLRDRVQALRGLPLAGAAAGTVRLQVHLVGRR